MKKIILFLCLFVFCFSFCACKSEKEEVKADNTAYITEQIMSISEDLSDEAAKGLSVVLRTNLENDKTSKITENKNFSDKTLSNEYLNRYNHIYNLVKQTEGETLYLKDNSSNFPIKYVLSSEENTPWQIKIKKSDILKFLKEENINLSNISKIKENKDNNGLLLSLDVAGKQISYNKLKSRFGLKSNKITSISSDISSITIFGEGTDYDENTFYIDKANNLSKNNLSYKEILSEFYKNSEIKSFSQS